MVDSSALFYVGNDEWCRMGYFLTYHG